MSRPCHFQTIGYKALLGTSQTSHFCRLFFWTITILQAPLTRPYLRCFRRQHNTACLQGVRRFPPAAFHIMPIHSLRPVLLHQPFAPRARSARSVFCRQRPARPARGAESRARVAKPTAQSARPARGARLARQAAALVRRWPYYPSTL